jgi:hypothetical protein
MIFVIGSLALLWLVTLSLCISVFALYRHIGRERLKTREGRLAQGPPDGSLVPSMQLMSAFGKLESVGGSGRPTMYYLGSSTCTACAMALPEAERASKQLARILKTVVILDKKPDDLPEAKSLPQSTGQPRELLFYVDRSLSFMGKLGISATPFVIITDDRGRIVGRGSPRRHTEFVSLALRALAENSPTAARDRLTSDIV